MKLSDILLIALVGVMGSLVFAMKQKQKELGNDRNNIPVPMVKPAAPHIAGLPELRLDLSTPETAGSYGRLSLDKFLAPSEELKQPVDQTLQPRIGGNLLLRDDDLGFDKAEALKSGAKHSKVRSVGMERQLTKRTSIGVEYVYKDGCYKKAIAALPVGNMPSDDGVNLRLNMRF